MARFIKFNIQNDGNGLTAGSGWRYVNVDDIESVYDGLTGGAGTVDKVTVVLKGSNASTVSAAYTLSGGGDGTATAQTSEISGRVLVLQVRTDATIAAGAGTNKPAAITVAGNMPSMAIRKAMSANPGGVAAAAQLSRDGDGATSDAQMVWNQFTISNTSPVPASS